MIHKGLWGIMLLLSLSCRAIAQTVSGPDPYLYITSVGGSLGMMLEPDYAPAADVLTLKGGDNFTLTVSSLNRAWSVKGRLVVGLVRQDNTVVDVMSSRTISENTSLGFMYFSCALKADTEVQPGDEVRLLFTEDNQSYTWVCSLYPGEAIDRIPATNYELPLCHITYPSHVLGATIRTNEEAVWSDKTVKGRNFYLYIEPDDPESIVVARVNGQLWYSSEDHLYMLSGVMQDCDVDIKVYPRGAVYPYKEIECSSTVRVADVLTEAEADCLLGLKAKGYLLEEDFTFFRTRMASLQILDLRESRTQYDVIPQGAFDSNRTLREIHLPPNTVALYNNAFRYTTNLASIVLPERLNWFGLNAFFGSSVKTVRVKWNPIEAGTEPLSGFSIPPCAFRATTYASDGTLIVPEGCVDAFRSTSIWENFKTIREPLPIDFLLELDFDRLLTGMDEVDAVREGPFEVEVSRGECCVIQTEPIARRVEVIEANGQLRASRLMDGLCTTFSLPKGFYVIRIGNASRKVLVP
ncbi:MAG: leucine-rich repeat domain-containing protein [Bacteroidaceae bacterium]|nr:leucine-rich repeat domain-containing protein [Bacteroidaceae bacterium]